MHKTVIIIGPTLKEETVKEILPDALVMPPAEQGDVDFARYQLGADIIGLIDGRHTHVLPVLHKEILSVLNDGCRFLGAASMGALRAVECEPYGAEPIGEVALSYKMGAIDADDEVCLAHAGKEQGYKHLSIPLVNIRATMAASKVDNELQKEVIEYAKALFYPDREWQNIFDGCDIGEETGQAIQDAFCDVKEADALQLCYEIAKGDKMASTVPKEIKYAHYGFAKNFEENDRKILHKGRIIRKFQIADSVNRYDRMNARNRALALELCKILGIKSEASIDWEYPDLTVVESIALGNDELMLKQAGDWIASRCSGADIVKTINDYLRISGRYEQTKEDI